MTITCAWCSRDLGEKPGPAGMVSHGLCKSCEDQLWFDDDGTFHHPPEPPGSRWTLGPPIAVPFDQFRNK